MSLLDRIWYQKHWSNYLLRPYGWVYRAVAVARRFAYKHRLLSSKKFNVPVIVVGNITVGGSGKTPLVIALVKWLQSEGYQPGVVSRGYKGKAKTWPQAVNAQSKPDRVGDEPVMIAKRTGCPLVVGPDRVAAVEKLINDYHCDVVVSDDGMQHYALQRDIEIAVVDGQRRLGNACCLPAGPLREPKARLKSVDFIVANGASQKDEWSMQLQSDKIINVADPTQVVMPDAIQTQVKHAIAGIGNPQRFFDQLEQIGFTVDTHPFPDHYAYRPTDINFGDNADVLMTEKDAVKCQLFADQRHWFVPVTAQLDAGFYQALKRRMDDVL